MTPETKEFSSLPVARPWYQPHHLEKDSVPTLTDIAKSYRTQWYRLEANGRHLALRPRGAEHNELWSAGGYIPRVLPRLSGQHIITWTHIPGTLSTTAARQARKERVFQLADRLSLSLTPIALLDATSKWIEPAATVECSWEQALHLAEANEQLAIGQFVTTGVYWWHALGGSEFNGEAESYTSLEESSWSAAPCPMSRGPETTFPVKREGGPGTSRGHAVSAMWSDHSAWAHSLVECEIHSRRGMTHRERGKALPLSEITPASRFNSIRFANGW